MEYRDFNTRETALRSGACSCPRSFHPLKQPKGGGQRTVLLSLAARSNSTLATYRADPVQISPRIISCDGLTGAR